MKVKLCFFCLIYHHSKTLHSALNNSVVKCDSEGRKPSNLCKLHDFAALPKEIQEQIPTLLRQVHRDQRYSRRWHFCLILAPFCGLRYTLPSVTGSPQHSAFSYPGTCCVMYQLGTLMLGHYTPATSQGSWPVPERQVGVFLLLLEVYMGGEEKETAISPAI